MPANPQQLAQALMNYRTAAPELQGQPQQPLMGQAVPQHMMAPLPQQQQQKPWFQMQNNPQMWAAMGKGMGGGATPNAFMPSQAFMNNQWGY